MSSLSKHSSRGRAHVSARRSPLTPPSPLISPDGPGHALRWVGTQIRAARYQRSVRRCGDQTNTIPLGQSSYAAYQHTSPCTLDSKKCIWLRHSHACTHTHTNTVQDSCMRRWWFEILCTNKDRRSRREQTRIHGHAHTTRSSTHQHGDFFFCP